MNYKQRPLYLCAFTKEWSKKVKPGRSIADHNYGKINNRLILWPDKIDSETINPKNFIYLKKYFKINELLFVDRIVGTNKPVSIINHVNRSGQNFLLGKTPDGKFPQFPDMSNIYHKISGLETITVHTIGKRRFQNPPDEEKVIWSEMIGLIAPVAHYVGIKVFAIGGSKFDDFNKIL